MFNILRPIKRKALVQDSKKLFLVYDYYWLRAGKRSCMKSTVQKFRKPETLVITASASGFSVTNFLLLLLDQRKCIAYEVVPSYVTEVKLLVHLVLSYYEYSWSMELDRYRVK